MQLILHHSREEWFASRSPPRSEVQCEMSGRDARQLCDRRLCSSYAARRAVPRPPVRVRHSTSGDRETESNAVDNIEWSAARRRRGRRTGSLVTLERCTVTSWSATVAPSLIIAHCALIQRVADPFHPFETLAATTPNAVAMHQARPPTPGPTRCECGRQCTAQHHDVCKADQHTVIRCHIWPRVSAPDRHGCDYGQRTRSVRHRRPASVRASQRGHARYGRPQEAPCQRDELDVKVSLFCETGRPHQTPKRDAKHARAGQLSLIRCSPGPAGRQTRTDNCGLKSGRIERGASWCVPAAAPRAGCSRLRCKLSADSGDYLSAVAAARDDARAARVTLHATQQPVCSSRCVVHAHHPAHHCAARHACLQRHTLSPLVLRGNACRRARYSALRCIRRAWPRAARPASGS